MLLLLFALLTLRRFFGCAVGPGDRFEEGWRDALELFLFFELVAGAFLIAFCARGLLAGWRDALELFLLFELVAGAFLIAFCTRGLLAGWRDALELLFLFKLVAGAFDVEAFLGNLFFGFEARTLGVDLTRDLGATLETSFSLEKYVVWMV